MSEAYKVWLFRVLAAVAGVGITAVAGVVADTSHFGAWFPIVAALQALVVAAIGNLVKKWTA